VEWIIFVNIATQYKHTAWGGVVTAPISLYLGPPLMSPTGSPNTNLIKSLWIRAGGIRHSKKKQGNTGYRRFQSYYVVSQSNYWQLVLVLQVLVLDQVSSINWSLGLGYCISFDYTITNILLTLNTQFS
jgi:hypothetical protein